MKDETYQKAFKEVIVILEYTQEELVQKIPSSFIQFMKQHMDKNYEVKITENVGIDKQPILAQTEAILSLLYKSYWDTEEEKKNFQAKEVDELYENLQREQEEQRKIEHIWEEKRKINRIEEKGLIVVKKENFLLRIWHKILKLKNKQ